ncbi:HAD-IA family hydrolase [Isosphaeraceae bacterium EP7]
MSTTVRWGDIRGIVFDAVGTLIEPSPSVSASYAAAATRQGIDVPLAEIKHRFRTHFRDDEVDEQLGPMVTSEPCEFRRWRRIVGCVLPELPDPDRAFRELWDHFGKPESWRPFADSAPTLQALREAGIPVRIGSNFDARLRGVLAGLPGLAEADEPPLISSEVGFRKPHPSFYRAASESLGMPVSAILFVGDDPENDVLGPVRAGLQGVLVDRGGERPDHLAHLPDLEPIVDFLLEAGSHRMVGRRGDKPAHSVK